MFERISKILTNIQQIAVLTSSDLQPQGGKFSCQQVLPKIMLYLVLPVLGPTSFSLSAIYVISLSLYIDGKFFGLSIEAGIVIPACRYF